MMPDFTMPRGDDLRKQLRETEALEADAEIQGLSPDENLERLVGIADEAYAHWLSSLPATERADG